MVTYDDGHFMRQALKEAQNAFDEGEIPIGAVIVINSKIIAKAHNQTERLNDATAHAEILAITAACSFLGAKYLPEAELFVTIEPCHMCAGALYWSKVKRVVYGAPDVKQGYRHFCTVNPFHPKTIVTGGILSADCAWLMQNFFKERR